MKITDEAVKTAALKLVEDLDLLMRHSEGVAGLHQNGDIAPWEEITEGGEFGDWLSSIENLRSALQKDPPHLHAGYKVKQLEWAEGGKGLAVRKFFSTNGMYSITENHGGSFIVETDNSSRSLGSTNILKDAKELAQSDFERRVRECIDSGVDVAEVRRQALEEALQAIAELPTPYSLANKDGREDCCDVIRALSEKPFNKEFMQSGIVSIDLMQRIWANLYFDEEDAGCTFGNTINDVVDWLGDRNALPESCESFTPAYPLPSKPVDVAEALNSAALIVEGRSTAANSELVKSLIGKSENEIAGIIANHDKELGVEIRALSAAQTEEEEK